MIRVKTHCCVSVLVGGEDRTVTSSVGKQAGDCEQGNCMIQKATKGRLRFEK